MKKKPSKALIIISTIIVLLVLTILSNIVLNKVYKTEI